MIEYRNDTIEQKIDQNKAFLKVIASEIRVPEDELSNYLIIVQNSTFDVNVSRKHGVNKTISSLNCIKNKSHLLPSGSQLMQMVITQRKIKQSSRRHTSCVNPGLTTSLYRRLR